MNNNAMKKVFGEVKSPFLDKELRDTIDGVNESNFNDIKQLLLKTMKSHQKYSKEFHLIRLLNIQTPAKLLQFYYTSILVNESKVA